MVGVDLFLNVCLFAMWGEFAVNSVVFQTIQVILTKPLKHLCSEDFDYKAYNLVTQNWS